MKKFLVAASLLAFSACTSVTPAELMLVSANILTLDADNPRAEFMVLQGGEIVAVGTEALAERYPGATRLDLTGRTIVPGFIDSHAHVREFGMDRIKADLVGAETVEDMVARLQARFPDPTPGVWLIGQGWDEGEFASRGYPDRAALDAAFPNNPVALESLHGFGGFYNGAALEIAGLDASTPDPEVGDILRRADGDPTGVMLTLAQDLVDQHIPQPDQAQREEAIVAALTAMAAAGVTSIHEAGMEPLDVAAFMSLRQKDALPIRVYGLLDGNDEALMAQWFADGILDDPLDWLDIRGIKVFYDGSLGSRTALMAEPYTDRPDAARPTERISPDKMRSLSDRAAAGGFQMAVHAIGDEGNNRTLNIYERALRGDASSRWRIEHAQVVLPDYYDRVAILEILSSVQSSHAVGDSGWAEDRVGPERIRNAYAWQRVLEAGEGTAGGGLMLNSDMPGEPWTPMETLYFAVTRAKIDGTPPGGWYADQALSVQEALEAMTLTNAYGAFQEDRLGSLEAGKWADFVVLDRDPTQTAPTALKDIRVLQSWVEGRPVYQAE